MARAADLNSEVFNLALALSSVGGDREFLTELIGLVQAAWPTLLADMKEGIAKGDLRTVETRARLAKVAARDVVAERAYQSAVEIEKITGTGDLRAMQEAMERLECEAELLQLALSTLESSECAA